MAIVEFVIIIIVVIVSIIITRKMIHTRKRFSLQSARAKEFLSPIPPNPTNPQFIPLLQRLHFLVTHAFIAESQRQMEQACEYYYWAFILDKELDNFYEKKILSVLESTYASLVNQKQHPFNNLEFDNEINQLLKQAQEAEQKKDGSTALRFYIDVNTQQCNVHRYLDAVQTANKISLLQKTLLNAK